MKWKILKENENYSINEKGEIKNNITKKILSPSINKDSGYYQIDLWKNNKSRKYTLHRLVANNFIPNLENKPTVDHIDGNRLNNDISNLRWATYSEQNSRFNTFGVRSEKIKVINVNGEELIFNRIKDVAEHFNCNISNISQMLKKGTFGKRGKTRNYKFIYMK
ncbi:MAG: NUMOD4 motif-containing HNH endonuclease [Clostridium sp.]|nr:NUMOD4 motif-containing HNH endonuclease [Clostridium sp.]